MHGESEYSAHNGSKPNEVLDRFGGDAEMLAKHGVTEEELELLKTVSLFGNLSSARDIAFILKNIRGTKRRVSGYRSAPLPPSKSVGYVVSFRRSYVFTWGCKPYFS